MEHIPNPVEYALPVFDEHEVEFRQYQHEQWEEDPKSWSPFITLEQLAARPDLEIDWYAPDWIPVGGKTILCAEPKMGKTILLFNLLKAITRGEKFLGQQCNAAKVLYLTEQTEIEFKRQVRNVSGLLGSKDFYVLLAEDQPVSRMRNWAETLVFIEEMLNITKAKVLVLDTFLSLAKLNADGENDSAVIQNTINAMNPLFKNRYLSVVLAHHTRKGRDQENDFRGGFHKKADALTLNSVRGSSAFGGGAGHVILMDAPNGTEDKDRRFVIKGRYMNEATINASLYPDGYHLKSANYHQ